MTEGDQVIYVGTSAGLTHIRLHTPKQVIDNILNGSEGTVVSDSAHCFTDLAMVLFSGMGRPVVLSKDDLRITNANNNQETGESDS